MDNGVIVFLRSFKVSETPAFDVVITILIALMIAQYFMVPPTLTILVLLFVSIPFHVIFGVSTETTRALCLG